MAAVQYRWGGFVISRKTATEWASRLRGRDLRAENLGGVLSAVQARVRPYKCGFNLIGETRAEFEYMIVTQSERLRADYKRGSPVPQFEEGEKEALARPLLDTEGVAEYEFRTVQVGVKVS